jgi:hypothetical protein
VAGAHPAVRLDPAGVVLEGTRELPERHELRQAELAYAVASDQEVWSRALPEHGHAAPFPSSERPAIAWVAARAVTSLPQSRAMVRSRARFKGLHVFAATGAASRTSPDVLARLREPITVAIV